MTLVLIYPAAAQSRPVSREIPLAPAILYALASSATMTRAAERCGDTPLNTQSLRCCHSIQASKMMREFNPFLTSLPTILEALHHQSSKLVSEACGAKSLRPTCRRRRNQNCRAKIHEERRWLIVSSSWSHRG
jgi:hypothetical protein